MSDHVIAALAGALTAAIGQAKEGWVSMLQTLITGFLCAYFLGESALIVISNYTDIVIIYSAVYFLIALFGAAIYERAKQIIKTWQLLR